MGKETKIGLAVIGVLVTIFSVLLVRHFRAGHLPPRGAETAEAPIKPLSSAGMSKTEVVVASPESSITGSKLWDDSATEAEPADAMVAGTEAVASAPANDPYQEPADGAGVQVAAAAEPEAANAEVAPVSRSPFDRSPAAVSGAGAEVPANSATASAVNPLRRTSATMPLEEPPLEEPPLEGPQAAAGDEPAAAEPNAAVMTLPAAEGGDEFPDANQVGQPGESAGVAAANDPFAAKSPAAQPQAALRDPFEAAPQAEPEAEPMAAGDAIGAAENFEPAADSTGQPLGSETPYETPAEADVSEAPAEPAPARNLFERSPAAPAARGAMPAAQAPVEDWQASPPAAEPQVTTPSEPAPLPLENGKYTVQPGDTLWSISEAVYGTGGYFKALAEHNRQMLPRSDALSVGSQLAVPPQQDLERDYPSLCPKQRKSALVSPRSQAAPARQVSGRDVYIVNQGDTLFDIARYELGKASRWAEIYDLNRDLLGEDFDYLRPGTELRMPPRGVQNAAQPADRY